MSTNIKPTFLQFFNILTSSSDKKLTLKQSSHKGVVWNPNFTIPLELLNQFSFVFYCFSSSSVSNVLDSFSSGYDPYLPSDPWWAEKNDHWPFPIKQLFGQIASRVFFTVDISYCIVLLYYTFQHILGKLQFLVCPLFCPPVPSIELPSFFALVMPLYMPSTDN